MFSKYFVFLNMFLWSFAASPRAAFGGGASEPIRCSPAPAGLEKRFQRGDLMVAVGNSRIKHFRVNGQQGCVLVQVLRTALNNQGNLQTGMCFDSQNNLYAADFNAGTMTKFDAQGAVLDHSWASFEARLWPESCVVDAQGDVYTGEVPAEARQDGDRSFIRKFQADGTPLLQGSQPWISLPNEHSREAMVLGFDWIDLKSDQRTILYTSEGDSVRAYDVFANEHLLDFASGLEAPCFALRIRINGEVLVACQNQVIRLDQGGAILQHYPVWGYSARIFFPLSLDPDGTSFWTADMREGIVYKIDIPTGDLLTCFDAELSEGELAGGLAAVDGPTAAYSGTIVIRLDAMPDDPQPFGFEGDLGSFTLRDDGSPSTASLSIPQEAGSFKVFAETPQGWDLDGIQCEDPSGDTTSDPKTGMLQIGLSAGETVSCEFLYVKRGVISISKETESNDPQLFDFSGDLGSFQLRSGEAQAFPVMPGQYQVTELSLVGWHVTQIDCLHPSGGTETDPQQRTAQVDVAAGQSVDCTFFNSRVSVPPPTRIPGLGSIGIGLLAALLAAAGGRMAGRKLEKRTPRR